MLTFVTIYLVRLYYPRLKAQQKTYNRQTRKNNYGNWAVKQHWQGESSYALA
ncbi:hypothetical protein [Chitinophaga caeni]|uniref:hypothetical protein n=1 Tax=Chitinophaga caeni TaxID=2029983 RepID=UPI0012FD3F23|nr:hypothetical protein [Chitinophaga caeni]